MPSDVFSWVEVTRFGVARHGITLCLGGALPHTSVAHRHVRSILIELLSGLGIPLAEMSAGRCQLPHTMTLLLENCMTPHACLAQEIAEFLDSYGLDASVPREITFLVLTDNEPAANGLVEVLSTRGFDAVIEAVDQDFWIVNARIICVPEGDALIRLCQRFLAVAEEFDCDVDGFRVHAEELVSRDQSSPDLTLDSNEFEGQSTQQMGSIIQELMEMGVEESELFEELGAISRACPAITRMARLHQAIELYQDRQYVAAYEMFEQLFDETPREQRALLPLMAFCKFHLEKFEMAARLFEFALALREGDPVEEAIDRLELTVHLGACLSRLGRFDEEAELYVRVLCEEPNHAKAHYNLACHASRCGEFDRSLMHLREAFVADPSLMPRAQDDGDLAAVRATSEFRAIVG